VGTSDQDSDTLDALILRKEQPRAALSRCAVLNQPEAK